MTMIKITVASGGLRTGEWVTIQGVTKRNRWFEFWKNKPTELERFLIVTEARSALLNRQSEEAGRLLDGNMVPFAKLVRKGDD